MYYSYGYMDDISRRIVIFIGIVTIVMIIGFALECYLGWKLFRIIKAVLGFSAGAFAGVIAAALLDAMGIIHVENETTIYIFALIGALLGVVIAYFLFYLDVFLRGFFIGILVLTMLFEPKPDSVGGALLLLLVFGVIGGVIALLLVRYAIIFLTGLEGGTGLGILIGSALNSKTAMILFTILFVATGILVQLFWTGRKGIIVGGGKQPYGQPSGGFRNPFLRQGGQPAGNQPFGGPGFGGYNQNQPFGNGQNQPFGSQGFGDSWNQPQPDRGFGNGQNQPFGNRGFGNGQNQPFGNQGFGNGQNQPFGNQGFGNGQNQPFGNRSFRNGQNQPAGNQPFGGGQNQPFGSQGFGDAGNRQGAYPQRQNPGAQNAGAQNVRKTSLQKPAQPQKQAASFCKRCGSPLKPGAKFCTKCGLKLQ